MNSTRALVLAILIAVSAIAVPLSAAGAAAIGPETTDASAHSLDGPAHSDVLASTDSSSVQDERDDDPTTEGTIGYVEGYWHDDELPVDDRDDAALEDDELEAVVYRSMARVEVIRELTFEEPDEVPVDVVDREEFGDDSSQDFEDATEVERLHQNIRFEALFMADRDTDATEEFSQLYGDAVGGFYQPATNEVVIVSDSPETPEMDELTLGHELVHALQDQHFDLASFDQETRDEANAKDGLIEGDASWVEHEYESRCGAEWGCVLPSEAPDQPASFNWGMYFTIFQPYSDGPTFIDHLYEAGGWEAVNDAYDEPPQHSAEIIHPDSYGEYDVDVTVEDRSSDRWTELEMPDGPNHSAFGEGAMASMFMYPTWESAGLSSIVPELDVLNDDDFDPINYDHEYTDGWAGDRLVKYVTDEESIDESGYVWETRWQSETDAEEFVDGYLQMLEYQDADPVDDRRNTFVVEDRYPGAYYLEDDGETVRIVKAPSVDELAEIHEGAAPEGEDTVFGNVPWVDGERGDDGDGEDADGGDDGGDGDGEDADGGDDEDGENATEDEIPGFGAVVAVVALLATVLIARRA